MLLLKMIIFKKYAKMTATIFLLKRMYIKTKEKHSSGFAQSEKLLDEFQCVQLTLDFEPC